MRSLDFLSSLDLCSERYRISRFANAIFRWRVVAEEVKPLRKNLLSATLTISILEWAENLFVFLKLMLQGKSNKVFFRGL